MTLCPKNNLYGMLIPSVCLFVPRFAYFLVPGAFRFPVLPFIFHLLKEARWQSHI